MESLAGYGSDDESNEMLQDNKEPIGGGSDRENKQEDDVNYDNVQMDMSEESNNNHTSGSSSSSSSGTSSSSSDSESDSDSDKHSSSSSSRTFSSGDERECQSPKATTAETPIATSHEASDVTATSQSEKDTRQPEVGSDITIERCSNSLQNPSDAKKHAHSSEDKKRSHSPDRQKHSHSPNTRRRKSHSSDRDKSHSRGNAKRRSRSRSRDRRRRGESSRSPERRKRSPSHRSRGDRKRSSHSPSERRRRSRSADRKKRSHSPSSRSHRGGDRERDRDRRSRSPTHRRPYEKKPNKLTILERLGIEIKAPNDPTAQPVTPQQLLQRSAEEQARQIKSTTGIEFPKYYNPAAMNPARYAEQMQKRRLLWGNKATTSTAKSDSSTPQTSTNKWEGTTFAQDQDGKMTAKFKRLMGIKDTAQGSSGSSGTEGNEILKKQEEMFNSMEMQYEVARVATHTHRGVGLGFGTFQYPR
ncbi:arginine/serine-rich coiled-coil protein 2-like isoform X1 [Schistocerca americana]|uniref:arginine/serine-rich coiled-coil protein 2-like isoform X1 n=1 Tax=Schistocerca americana TaxID=7009 RepID=UPI001F50061A|nr:arginine/serine-rich coiled-coil protein 2-like isoform X1 [Schistocerca americana]